MSNVSNESPSTEGYALAVSTASTTPINLSVDNASALNASSPIQRLPKELFSEIFLHCIASNQHGSLSLHYGSWLLLSVCRYWYTMVTTTPSLWRDIRLRIRCLTECRDPVAVLSLVLSRAGKMDLFVELDATSASDEEGNVPRHTSNLAADLMVVLIKYRTQWRTLKLVGLDAEDSEVRCLSVHQQLTELEMEGVLYKSSLVEMLRDCRRLQCLGLHFTLRSPPVGARVTSQLTRLYLRDFFDDLALVDLPNLGVLRIDNEWDESLAIVVPALLDLLKYSRCPLTSLQLINCNVEGLAGVLELGPLLNGLTISLGESLPSSAAFIAAVDESLLKLMVDLGKVDLVPQPKEIAITLDMNQDGLLKEMTFFKREEALEMLSRRSKHNGMEWHFYFLWDGWCMWIADYDDDDEEAWQEEE